MIKLYKPMKQQVREPQELPRGILFPLLQVFSLSFTLKLPDLLLFSSFLFFFPHSSPCFPSLSAFPPFPQPGHLSMIKPVCLQLLGPVAWCRAMSSCLVVNAKGFVETSFPYSFFFFFLPSAPKSSYFFASFPHSCTTQGQIYKKKFNIPQGCCENKM